jgi:hypothetical protein
LTLIFSGLHFANFVMPAQRAGITKLAKWSSGFIRDDPRPSVSSAFYGSLLCSHPDFIRTFISGKRVHGKSLQKEKALAVVG